MQYITLRKIMIDKFNIKADEKDKEIDDVEHEYSINADYLNIAKRAFDN